MRIAVVTSLVRKHGTNGEDRAALDQVELLTQAGHDARLFARSSDDLVSELGYPLRAAYTVATGRGYSPIQEIARFRPDVVHVHNTYPNIGRRWLRGVDAAVVSTLHSYRPFCAAATFFRDGRPCQDCLHRPLSAVLHGCYDGRLRSLPYAASHLAGVDPLLDRADRIIVLNPAARQVLIEAGYRASKITQGVNTFVNRTAGQAGAPAGSAASAPDHAGHLRRWLYAGRLSEAKGVAELLRRWPDDVALDIVGEGPLREELARSTGPAVRLRGHMAADELALTMAASFGLVFPSRGPEMLPLAYVEALAQGLPTMAFEPNTVADLVREQRTGMVVSWDDDLSGALRQAAQAFPELRAHCHRVFAATYSPEAYLRHLLGTYEEALAERGSSAAAR